MDKCLIKDLKFFYDSWLIGGGGQLKMYDIINGHSISFDIKLAYKQKNYKIQIKF